MPSRLLRGWTNTRAYDAGTMVFPPIRSARGVILEGYDGARYIDAKSQMMNVSFGHGVASFQRAVFGQWDELAYAPAMDGHGNPPAEVFVTDLLTLLPDTFRSAYLSCTGTTCCEIALQIARDHHRRRGEPRRRIASIDGCYHGNTAMMSEVSDFDPSNPAYRLDDPTNYLKLVRPYCYRCPLGLGRATCGEACADAVARQIALASPETIAAVIVEFVQGSGAIALPQRYVAELFRVARHHGILVIADEVLTGLGRTGYDFAFQRFGVSPNIVCLSKTLSNGLLPLAATVLDAELTAGVYDHEILVGSTQDGNPVCAALGSAVVAHYRASDWPARVRRLGDHLRSRLAERLAGCAVVGEVRGEGLLVCVELVSDRASRAPYDGMRLVHDGMLREGVFAFAEKNFLTLVPPYVVDEELLDTLIDKTARVLGALAPRPGDYA